METQLLSSFDSTKMATTDHIFASLHVDEPSSPQQQQFKTQKNTTNAAPEPNTEIKENHQAKPAAGPAAASAQSSRGGASTATRGAPAAARGGNRSNVDAGSFDVGKHASENHARSSERGRATRGSYATRGNGERQFDRHSSRGGMGASGAPKKHGAAFGDQTEVIGADENSGIQHPEVKPDSDAIAQADAEDQEPVTVSEADILGQIEEVKQLGYDEYLEQLKAKQVAEDKKRARQVNLAEGGRQKVKPLQKQAQAENEYNLESDNKQQQQQQQSSKSSKNKAKKTKQQMSIDEFAAINKSSSSASSSSAPQHFDNPRGGYRGRGDNSNHRGGRGDSSNFRGGFRGNSDGNTAQFSRGRGGYDNNRGSSYESRGGRGRGSNFRGGFRGNSQPQLNDESAFPKLG